MPSVRLLVYYKYTLNIFILSVFFLQDHTCAGFDNWFSTFLFVDMYFIQAKACFAYWTWIKLSLNPQQSVYQKQKLARLLLPLLVLRFTLSPKSNKCILSPHFV